MILGFFAYPFAAADGGCGVWRPAQIFAAEVVDNCLLHWFDTDLNRVLEIDGNMILRKNSNFIFLKYFFFFVYLHFSANFDLLNVAQSQNYVLHIN